MSQVTDYKTLFYTSLRDATGPTTLSIEDQFFDEGVNPGLVIEGIGKINLPIADNVKFGDSAVEQVPASKIQFRNAGFQKWLDEYLTKLRDAASFEADGKTAKPRLHSLVVHGVQSSSSAVAQGLSLEDNFFGFLTVTLESDFDGGEFELRADSRSEAFAKSGNEEFECSVISWYSGATASIGPITRGRRAMLLYSLHWSDSNVPKLQSPNANLEKAMQGLKGTGQRLCYQLPPWDLRDRSRVRNLLGLAKQIWGTEYEVYRAKTYGDSEPGYEQLNLGDFSALLTQLGNMPGFLVWDNEQVSWWRNSRQMKDRACLVIWPLSQHADIAVQFRARADKWNSHMGGGLIKGLVEVKPTTEEYRIMWLRTLIVCEVGKAILVEFEKPMWNKFWELLDTATKEWRELTDKVVPASFIDAFKIRGRDEVIEFYCLEIYRKDRLQAYQDIVEKLAWEIAVQGTDSELWTAELLNSRYTKSKYDWTRVFMAAINLMPYIEWYRSIEKRLAKGAFTAEISRPLALPLLVQNFQVDFNGMRTRFDPRTNSPHTYHIIRFEHVKLLIEMIDEAKYKNRDIFFEMVLPKLKCPERLDNNLWEALGTLLRDNYANSSSPVMKKFAQQYEIDLVAARKR